MTRIDGRRPTRELWHFTCDHGRKGIGEHGTLQPHQHVLLPSDSRLTVAWSAIRARHVAMAPDVVADLERHGVPSTWWLSFGPIRAELA